MSIPFGERMYLVTVRVLIHEDGPADAVTSVRDALSAIHVIDCKAHVEEGPLKVDHSAEVAPLANQAGDQSQQAIEAAAAAFHQANKERNHLRWENCSEQYRREIRELIRPAAEAAFRVGFHVDPRFNED